MLATFMEVLDTSVANVALPHIEQSTMLAFADVFWVMALLFLVILPLMFFIKRVGPVQGPLIVE